MLGGPQFYIQLVGEVSQEGKSIAESSVVEDLQGSAKLSNTNGNADQGSTWKQVHSADTKWSLEFRDTPDPKKDDGVTSRLMFRNPIEDGDILRFMKDLGYQ